LLLVPELLPATGLFGFVLGGGVLLGPSLVEGGAGLERTGGLLGLGRVNVRLVLLAALLELEPEE
jgi:hypothetical protein